MMAELIMPEYCYPGGWWKTFHPIFDKSKTYSEFKMRCELAGYTEPAYNPRYTLKCYEAFVCSQAVGDLKFDEFRRQMFAGFHRDSRII